MGLSLGIAAGNGGTLARGRIDGWRRRVFPNDLSGNRGQSIGKRGYTYSPQTFLLLYSSNFWWHGSLESVPTIRTLAWKEISRCPLEILPHRSGYTFYFSFIVSRKKRRLPPTSLSYGSGYAGRIFFASRRKSNYSHPNLYGHDNAFGSGSRVQHPVARIEF